MTITARLSIEIPAPPPSIEVRRRGSVVTITRGRDEISVKVRAAPLAEVFAEKVRMHLPLFAERGLSWRAAVEHARQEIEWAWFAAQRRSRRSAFAGGIDP